MHYHIFVPVLKMPSTGKPCAKRCHVQKNNLFFVAGPGKQEYVSSTYTCHTQHLSYIPESQIEKSGTSSGSQLVPTNPSQPCIQRNKSVRYESQYVIGIDLKIQQVHQAD